MAEFPNLGIHCALEHCHCLDFLPFVCDSCKKTHWPWSLIFRTKSKQIFILQQLLLSSLDHRQPSDHQCINPISVSLDEKIPSITTHSRCSFGDCKNRELVDIVCKYCHANVCLHHRHQQDHACTALPKMETEESKTSALVKSILESKSYSSSNEKRRPEGNKSSKMLARVNLMKMKMTAVGDKGLPPDERVYLMTIISSGTNENDLALRTKAFYFSKTWTVGRVVDYVAAVEKLWNMNNVSSAKKLMLFVHDGYTPLAMDMPLEELISCNILCNGDTVSLQYNP